MIIENIFFIWAIWYFYAYGVPPQVNQFFMKFYVILDIVIEKYNKLIYQDIWETFSDTDSESLPELHVNSEVNKPVLKYEDKYLDIIRQLNKEWQFTKDEIEEKQHIYEDFYEGSVNNIKRDIDLFNQEIDTYKNEIANDTDTINFIENCNDEGDELIEETTLEERNEYRLEQIKELTEKLDTLKNKIETDEGLIELRADSENQAKNYIINKKIEKLKNCYVMEKTPQGNVLMIYDKDKESFKYYSDGSIPYRYLEVVCRKYVKFFNCRPLFVDMEEELKLCDEKWTKEYELKKIKEAQEKLKAEEYAKNNKPTEQKKNVFAKFKSYNKDSGGKISMATPPKNNIPNNTIFETKEDEKILLKERANRYTYEGKFANFNFLQKIERKIFNKKLGISFSDFKKMKN
jgi:hypothetical protein